jgi:GT2 family glycosyltransferase
LNKKVVVVVLAWDHIQDTIETIQSLLESDYDNYKIVLVDNSSTDNTVASVKSMFPKVHILTSEVNRGVSGGYNLGMKWALEQDAEYVIVANNDITVDPQMIGKLVFAAESDQYCGMVMPKIYHYYGDPTRIWCTGAYHRLLPPAIKMQNYNKLEIKIKHYPLVLEFAPSCVLLITKATIREIGYFDENFFFYYDDWDYSARTRKAGFKILFSENAIMRHKISMSTQKSVKPLTWWRQLGWSAAYYAEKNLPTSTRFGFRNWLLLREILKLNLKQALAMSKGIHDFNSKKPVVEVG